MQYAEAVWVPLTPTGTMGADSLLASTLDTLRRTADNVGSVIPIDRYPQTITTNDIMAEQITADDTALDQSFQWIPENTGTLDKMFINLAVLMEMTVATSGSQIWDTIRVTITRVGGTDVMLDRTYNIARTVSAIGHHLEIIADSVYLAGTKVRAGNQLDIRVRTTNTKSMTNTSTLVLAHSGVMFYITRDRK